LINYLEQKEEPLPDYMVNILKQVAIGTTYKTVLEQQMSLYNRNKTRAAHNMIRHIVHDSIVDNNLLRQWLNAYSPINKLSVLLCRRAITPMRWPWPICCPNCTDYKMVN